MEGLNQRRLERRPLWSKDSQRYEAVLEILFRHDPLRICMAENPKRETEYANELDTILPCLSVSLPVDEIQQVVYEEFVRWFGASARSPECYRKIALELQQWLQGQAF